MTPASTVGGPSEGASAGEPLVILAAGGALPYEVAKAAAAAGRNVFVLGLEGAADDRLREFPHEMVKWGQIGRMEHLVRAHHAREIVMTGTVDKRPDFSSIAVDFGTLKYLPRLLKAFVGGDDTVLGRFVRALEEAGFRVVGAHEVAPSLVAPPGLIAGPQPSAAALTDARLAMEAARAIGALDIGQAAIAVDGRIVAVEAAEGTDAMIERVGVLRENGRVRSKGRSGVLAKRAKPQQELRLDMPVIGPATIEAAARAGLAGVVIEAGRVIIADRAVATATAERTATFVTAVESGQ